MVGFLLANILMALCWATSWSAPRLVKLSLPATILYNTGQSLTAQLNLKREKIVDITANIH
jgi:hypothetical protein